MNVLDTAFGEQGQEGLDSALRQANMRRRGRAATGQDSATAWSRLGAGLPGRSCGTGQHKLPPGNGARFG